MRKGLTALLLAILVAAMLTLAAGRGYGQQGTVTLKVFDGITTAQTSNPVRNIGQVMHLITVVFPAESNAVTGLQVRIEASFDQTSWFPISNDITAAAAIGGRVYQMEKAFGPWPFIRVRSLNSTSSRLMTVYYSGSLIPTVSAILQATDRFLL